MDRFVYFGALSCLLVSLAGISTHNNINNIESSEIPAEIAWFQEQPEFKSFEREISQESADKMIEDFWQAGFSKKWEYFWQSDDDVEQKKIKAASFYEDAKKYWRDSSNVEGVALLARLNFTLSWAMAKTADNMQVKDIRSMLSGNPMVETQARVLMCERILNENGEIVTKRIQTIMEHVIEIFRRDIKAMINP